MFDLTDVLLPECIENITEIKEVNRVMEKQIKKLKQCVDATITNLTIMTSDAVATARREKILGIAPLDTDTLDDRRFRVLINWYDTYPYTEKDLIDRLDRLGGKGEYVLEVDKARNHVKCLLELTSRKKTVDVEKLLDQILSLNVSLEVLVRYNQWFKFKQKTWQELSNKTWDQLRNEVMV